MPQMPKGDRHRWHRSLNKDAPFHRAIDASAAQASFDTDDTKKR
jgi:hypothetical protein